jgi:putative transposase
MPYDPHRHARRSLRLNGYDYSQPGAYFVTICTRQPGQWFGHIQRAVLVPNEAGRMVAETWATLQERFSYIALDTSIVMPDHLHGILHIVAGPTPPAAPRQDGRPRGTLPGTLGRALQAFKSLTTVAYIEGVHERGWPPFDQRLWHRNYYDRIVRRNGALPTIRDYIASNPARWAGDEDNKGQ